MCCSDDVILGIGIGYWYWYCWRPIVLGMLRGRAGFTLVEALCGVVVEAPLSAPSPPLPLPSPSFPR